MNLSQILRSKCNKDISTCTNEELYFVLLEIVQELGEQKVKKKQDKRKLYYISAEFLIGKLLSNNLINLGIYDEVKKILAENGKNLSEVEEVEPEPSLGNGGLGRLAACFLDSIATLGLNGDGIGLNYHFGLFKQVFKNNLQSEQKNEWIEQNSWLNKTDTTYEIECGEFKLKSRLYEVEKQKRDSELANERKSQVGSGDRSEKIRTYNYPQGRITDHRIGLSIYQMENFLNGDLDEMIDNLIAADRAEKLQGNDEE